MRPRSAAIIACRVIALYLGVNALIQIVSFLLVVRSLNGSGFFWATFGTRAVVAVALWIVADQVGIAMTREIDDTASPRPMVDSLTIAITVVGVVLVVQAIPDLIEVAIRQTPGFPLSSESPLFLSGSLIGNKTAEIVGGITQLVIGIVLIAAGRPLADVVRRRMPEEKPPAA
ncbi:MAG: hypothetical protein WAT66_00530 [Actinomycetota bacterium]